MDQLDKIDFLQLELVKSWHQATPSLIHQGFLGLVEKQHLQNFLLWHEEDLARAPDADDSEITRVKRSIDTLNQRRNDLIEQLDEALLKKLNDLGIGMNDKAPANSETPGNIIDRGSIMALKIFHMQEQTLRQDVDHNHLEEAARKVKILQIQRADLFECLSHLLTEIKHGTRRFRLYKQFKMYNDPTLNPKIYSANNR